MTQSSPKADEADSASVAQQTCLDEFLFTSAPTEAEPAPLASPFLDTSLLGASQPTENRELMNLLISSHSPKESKESPTASSHLSFFAPTITALATRIRQELEANLPALLEINRSRRDGIAQHLDRLAGIAPAPGLASAPSNPLLATNQSGLRLRAWIEGPRTPSQQLALQCFFEEIALINLGQAILLKAWSDRGIRPWKEADLGDLNAAMNSALQSKIPIDREGWQVTQRNLYSWYKIGKTLQREIWTEFEAWRIVDEGPELLIGLLRLARQVHTERIAQGKFGQEIPRGYDERFFSSLWSHLGALGFEMASADPKRRKTVFSPTLRDGAMVRTGPTSLSWIALDAHPFQLLMAELGQLWWGPAAPPVWSIGNGLEVHSREQLTLNLTSPKPSLLQRIAEMEACDLAIVLEELTIRPQGRSAEAISLKDQLESLPYFKKLRSAGTSLGDLQACVSLSKLRPGGLLIWAREEPLCEADGTEALRFLLDRSRLLCEWNLSNLSHALPRTTATGGAPIFPKYLYFFAREPQMQERIAHRPFRMSVQGQIRSHVEVPLVIEDALQSLAKGSPQSRGNWKVHLQQSPTPQKEWAERWPDAAAEDDLREMETQRAASSPLGSTATVRATPEGDPKRGGAWSMHAQGVNGFWIRAELSEDRRRLVASPLPQTGQDTTGSGFIVLVSDETSVAPLKAYLESERVQKWLDHHCERRGNRWHLKDSDVKWIPVPKALLGALCGPRDEASFALPLPGDWERLAAEVAFKPRTAIERLAGLVHDETGKRIRSALFVRAARTVEHLRANQERVLSLVTADGRVRWSELLKILPQGECAPVSLHPRIRLVGSMPLQIPITRVTRVKMPVPGLMLTTESGLNLTIASESPLLLDMLAEQLEALSHPTWSEITEFVRLPRRIELAETTASDVIRMHGEQTLHLRALGELISLCLQGI